MIVNTSYKKEAFIRQIAKHFGDGKHSQDPSGIWYFGGGYWRGVEGEHRGSLAVRLENQDFSGFERSFVERGIATIERLGYVGPGDDSLAGLAGSASSDADNNKNPEG